MAPITTRPKTPAASAYHGTLPLSQLPAAVDEERDQRNERPARVDDEDAFQSPKALAHHAGKRTLQAHRDAACETDENDKKDGFHGFVLFLFDDT